MEIFTSTETIVAQDSIPLKKETSPENYRSVIQVDIVNFKRLISISKVGTFKF